MSNDYQHMIQQTLFWMFVPSLISSVLMRVYTYIAGGGVKKSSSATAAANAATAHRNRIYNRIYITVVLAYLLYSFIQVEQALPENLYDYLNLQNGPISATDAVIKSNYRRLSRIYHPDKMMDQPLEVKELMEDRYIHIQKAYETLKNEGKRLAYDKFGPESLECSHCRIEKDYLTYSLTNLIIFYSSSLTVIALLSLLGGGTRYGTYWRCTGIFTLATYEAYCVLCSHDPLLTLLPTSRHTMYEKIILLRHASVAAFVAISQIGPILFPPSTATKFKLQDSLLSLNDATGLILKEAKFGLKMSVDPFVGDGKMVGRLQRRMEKLAVDLKLQETLGNEYKKVADRTRSSARKKMN